MEIELLSDNLNSQLSIYSLSMKDNYLLIGTWRDGLLILDTEKNKVNHYRANRDDSLSLRSNIVPSIFITSKGIIWLGTFEGLNQLRLNKETGNASFILPLKDTSRIYTALSHKLVVSMYEDKRGFLWIGTARILEN